MIAAIAVWKKVISFGLTLPSSCLQSLQHFLFLYLCFCVFYNGPKKWTELNELNELENSKAPSHPQTCINIFFFDRIQIRKKRIELNKLNELNELNYWKAHSQMSTHARKHVFLYLHAQTCINITFYLLHLNQKKGLS